MIKLNHKLLALALALSAAIALSGCAAGGSGFNSPGSANTVNPTVKALFSAVLGGPADVNVPASSTIVNFAPEPSYSGTEERQAINLLNTERARCGFGKLKQNTQLDAAARSHADYQIRNNLDSHFEHVSKYPAGFTGITQMHRAEAKGYTGAAAVSDEYSFFTGSADKAGRGVKGIRSLLNAPYHVRGMMAGYRDVGLTVRSNADVGASSPAVFLGLNAAYKRSEGPQLLASNVVATFPCEGSLEVQRQLLDESPNPVPGRNLAVQPLGSTIYVAVRVGYRLKITSATMTRAGTNQAVRLRTPITSTNDPHAPCETGCFEPHEGYIASDAPLEPNTAYQVSIQGTNSGERFIKSFRFMTGS